jgi:hypothetical protein
VTTGPRGVVGGRVPSVFDTEKGTKSGFMGL